MFSMVKLRKIILFFHIILQLKNDMKNKMIFLIFTIDNIILVMKNGLLKNDV